MAVYAITGKLGSGKGKAAIDQMRRYLLSGKRVATNCDLFLEHLLPSLDRSTVIRIPDKPLATDLYMIGSGNKYIKFDPILNGDKGLFSAIAPSPKLLDGFDECHNGALVLDECGSWLNTRNFQDKGRVEMLEWAIHARKYGWDVYFVMQNISQVDKQLRDSLLEYVVRLNRLDRMKVPFISSGIKLMTAGAFDGSMPRLHIGVVRLGSAADALVADRWIFRGDDLNNAYNTTQVFSEHYPHAIHCLLSSWHLSAKFSAPVDFVGPLRLGEIDKTVFVPRSVPIKPFKHMKKLLTIALIFGAVLGGSGMYIYPSLRPPVKAIIVPPVYAADVRGVGVVRFDGKVSLVTLSDGRMIRPKDFRLISGGWEALLPSGQWVKGVF